MYCSSLAKRTLIAAYSLLFTFQFPFTGYSFDRFTMEVFRHEIASSTLNLHYTLTDPKAYKIKEKEP